MYTSTTIDVLDLHSDQATGHQEGYDVLRLADYLANCTAYLLFLEHQLFLLPDEFFLWDLPQLLELLQLLAQFSLDFG